MLLLVISSGIAEAKLHALALRMNRNGLLAEKRSRLLLAIRQTYNDFFHDYFVSSDQVFKLRVSPLDVDI